jgi:hypothetical protein
MPLGGVAISIRGSVSSRAALSCGNCDSVIRQVAGKLSRQRRIKGGSCMS